MAERAVPFANITLRSLLINDIETAGFPPAKSREPPTEGAAWNTGVRVEDVFVVSYKKLVGAGKILKKSH
jgi:hypothetical protein